MNPLFDVQHLTFAHPYFFALFALLPVLYWWQHRQRKLQKPALRLTTLQGLSQAGSSPVIVLKKLLPALRYLALSALIIAIARPQSTNTTINSDTEGIDIVLSMDISGSMTAEDFSPNRLEAAKEVAFSFVDMRPSDRMGLVIFSGESYTLCPLTIDHNVLKEQIGSIKNGLVQDGTAIGMGLATAVDRLRTSKAKSKVIVLMTDGVNNSGMIDPLTALEIAKIYKIKVYTIGIGAQGKAPVTVPGMGRQMMDASIDEPLLRRIAAETGGNYYRATGNKKLKSIYESIDKLEKSTIEVTSYKRRAELFLPFALLAACLLALELALNFSVLRSIT